MKVAIVLVALAGLSVALPTSLTDEDLRDLMSSK